MLDDDRVNPGLSSATLADVIDKAYVDEKDVILKLYK